MTTIVTGSNTVLGGRTTYVCVACQYSTEYEREWRQHTCPAFIRGEAYPVLERIWENPQDESAFGGL